MATFSADHYLAVANGYFRTGAMAQASDVCRNALVQHPEDARLWDRLGVAAWAMGDWRTAQQALENAWHREPLRPMAQLALADAYCGLGHNEQASSLLLALAQPNGCPVRMLPDVAKRLFHVGLYARAERTWRRVLRKQSHWAEGHYQRAVCLWAMEADSEELFEPLHEAVMLAPHEPKYALALANVWLEVGSPCDAADVLTVVDVSTVTCVGCITRMLNIFLDVADEHQASLCADRLKQLLPANESPSSTSPVLNQ